MRGIHGESGGLTTLYYTCPSEPYLPVRCAEFFQEVPGGGSRGYQYAPRQFLVLDEPQLETPAGLQGRGERPQGRALARLAALALAPA